MNTISTFGALKKSGYVSKTIKEEMRQNLISKMKAGEERFPGIIGYEDTVIPDTERAILSRHNMLFLGLRGQAKTRLARQMTDLLDEYIPYISGSDIYDDPFHPISSYGKQLIADQGDKTPISWLHREERYGEKLATPDVSVADLIGDIDPVKAANLRLNFSDERVIHYGIIPRSNRCIFVINELPDLQARIQVALFNILQEGDIQIRGFKLRLPLDIVFVFTANPEDYTNRGSIVTPLKDRIESQILTHYPKTIESALTITAQEASIHGEQEKLVEHSDLVSRIIEQVAFEARSSEFVDQKSGVSARLTIAALENAFSSAERRALINKEKSTQVWMSDLQGIIPAITGKIELVYEGEQEGPYQVSVNLLERSIRTIFIQYFPDPEEFKKKRNKESTVVSPYKQITQWFDEGNQVNMLFHLKDADRVKLLNSVTGLSDLVLKYYPKASGKQKALLMEFVLYGLSAYSLISKKILSEKVEFRDLMGAMFTGDEDMQGTRD
ncbi:MAG: magnesium chelatase [bacterium]